MPEDCKTPMQCPKAFQRLSNMLSRQWILRRGPFHFMKQAQDQVLDMPDVCPPCRVAFNKEVNNVREDAWRNLPAVVGLPSWEELEAEARETVET